MTTRKQKRANATTTTTNNNKPLRSVGMCSDLPLRSPRQTWPLFPPRTMMMMMSSSYEYADVSNRSKKFEEKEGKIFFKKKIFLSL